MKITNNPAFGQVTIWLRAKSKGDKVGFKEYSLQVCKPYTSITYDSSVFEYVSNVTGTADVLTVPQSWFLYDPTFTSLSCIITWTISTDAPGASIVTAPPLELDTSGTPTAEGMYPLKVTRTTAGYSTRYLQIKYSNSINYATNTIGYQTYNREILIEICGSETVTLNSPTPFSIQYQ